MNRMVFQPELPLYYAAFLTTRFSSLEVVRRDASEALAEHLCRSRELHSHGELVMAGAFLDRPGEPISTMAVLVSEDAAKRFVDGDPFVRLGLVSDWIIRPWANILRTVAGEP